MADMVSRDTGSRPPRKALPEALFDSWRLLLSRAARLCARGFRAAGRTLSRGLGGLSSSVSRALTGSRADRRRLALPAGLAALAVQIALAALLAAPSARPVAAGSALVAALWVMARLPAMRIVASRPAGDPAANVEEAWVAGALLHLLAFTPTLRLITWAAGAVVGYAILRRSGSRGREATLLVGAGFGLEAVGFVLMTVVRSMRVAAILLGGAG